MFGGHYSGPERRDPGEPSMWSMFERLDRLDTRLTRIEAGIAVMAGLLATFAAIVAAGGFSISAM